MVPDLYPRPYFEASIEVTTKKSPYSVKSKDLAKMFILAVYIRLSEI